MHLCYMDRIFHWFVWISSGLWWTYLEFWEICWQSHKWMSQVMPKDKKLSPGLHYKTKVQNLYNAFIADLFFLPTFKPHKVHLTKSLISLYRFVSFTHAYPLPLLTLIWLPPVKDILCSSELHKHPFCRHRHFSSTSLCYLVSNVSLFNTCLCFFFCSFPSWMGRFFVYHYCKLGVISRQIL